MSERQIEVKIKPLKIDHYEFLVICGRIEACGRTFVYDLRENTCPSLYGIDNGHIDLLEIIEEAKAGEKQKGSIILYKRGWPTKSDGTADKRYMPINKDDVQMAVYGKILEMYN